MLIAIDTGGTKTIITGFTRAGKPDGEHRFPTPRDTDDYIGTLSELIHEHYMLKGRAIDAIVIGVPGPVRNNVVSHCVNLGWKNFDIAGRLSILVGNVPIWLENDANLAGLSETVRLDTEPRNSLYVTISTGIGTGIISGGRIDPNMSLSEGGHMLLEHEGKLQLWQRFASGKAITEKYGKYARDITSERTWNQIADNIAVGFLALLPVVAPDIVIIGGSIGTHFNRYKDRLRATLKTKLPEAVDLPTFRQAKYPEEAVIYGCYYHGIQKLTEQPSA